MTLAIFKETVRSKKVSTAIWALSMALFALMLTALHHTFAQKIGLIADNFPEGISAIVGNFTQAVHPAGFLGLELYNLFLPLVLAIVGLGLGASVIGAEEESGTLELLLASPVSRSRIIIEKLAAIKFNLFFIAMATWAGVALGTKLFAFNVNLLHVALASLSAFLLGMIYAMAALAGQSVSGKRSIGVGVGAGFLAVTYVGDVVSKLVTSFDWIKYISPFYYFDVGNVLFGNGQLKNFAILTLVSILFYGVAHIWFIRRDTGV